MYRIIQKERAKVKQDILFLHKNDKLKHIQAQQKLVKELSA